MRYSLAWRHGTRHPFWCCTASRYTQGAAALQFRSASQFGHPPTRSLQQRSGSLLYSSSRPAAVHQHSTQRLPGWHFSTANNSSSSSAAHMGCARTASHAAAGCTTSVNSHVSGNNREPEMCVIVDKHNNVIGAATRRETVSKRLLGRGAYVLVFNSAGQLFVSQRSKFKDCYPGCLDVTISGVVNQGEEYADTAVRELQEEISIPLQESSSNLQQLFIFPYEDATCHVFGCAFRFTWDGPVTFADAEVESGRFMSMQELQQLLQDDPEQFTPVGRHILGLYVRQQEQHAD